GRDEYGAGDTATRARGSVWRAIGNDAVQRRALRAAWRVDRGCERPAAVLHLALHRHSNHRVDLHGRALLARAKRRRYIRARSGGSRFRNQGTEEIAMDWKQLWEIISAPDNVPIIALIPLLAFYIYLAWRQAHANDQLIEQLEGDAALAKTHHRK